LVLLLALLLVLLLVLLYGCFWCAFPGDSRDASSAFARSSRPPGSRAAFRARFDPATRRRKICWEAVDDKIIQFKTHVLASWPEYNHRYAHPFEWTWTNQKMRQWFAKHAPNSLQNM